MPFMSDSHDNKFNVYKYFNDNILPKYVKLYLPISWISIKSYKLCGKFNKESFDTHEYEKETFEPYFQGILKIRSASEIVVLCGAHFIKKLVISAQRYH